jgi:uncharacterized protein
MVEQITFGGEYQRRIVDDELFPLLPAIVLDGPKGVGMTTTALQRCNSVRRLSRKSERLIVEADPLVIAEDDSPLLIDEWQLVPEVWDAVCEIVDRNNVPSYSMLTGSAPLRSTHSGAARMTSVRVRPLTLPERGVSTPSVSLTKLLAGGVPSVSGRTGVKLTNYVDEIWWISLMPNKFWFTKCTVGLSNFFRLDVFL